MGWNIMKTHTTFSLWMISKSQTLWPWPLKRYAYRLAPRWQFLVAVPLCPLKLSLNSLLVSPMMSSGCGTHSQTPCDAVHSICGLWRWSQPYSWYNMYINYTGFLCTCTILCKWILGTNDMRNITGYQGRWM